MVTDSLVSSAVTKLTITHTMQLGSFRQHQFVRLEGIAYGELHPSENIPDLDRAPRNGRGNIDPVSFTLA